MEFVDIDPMCNAAATGDVTLALRVEACLFGLKRQGPAALDFRGQRLALVVAPIEIQCGA